LIQLDALGRVSPCREKLWCFAVFYLTNLFLFRDQQFSCLLSSVPRLIDSVARRYLQDLMMARLRLCIRIIFSFVVLWIILENNV